MAAEREALEALRALGGETDAHERRAVLRAELERRGLDRHLDWIERHASPEPTSRAEQVRDIKGLGRIWGSVARLLRGTAPAGYAFPLRPSQSRGWVEVALDPDALPVLERADAAATMKTPAGSYLHVTLTAGTSETVSAAVDGVVVGRAALPATGPRQWAFPSQSSSVTVTGEFALVGDPPRPLVQVQLPATDTP